MSNLIQEPAVDYNTLSLIASRTENAVMLTDPESHILWVNDRFCEITEYSIEEVIGFKPSAILQGEESDVKTIKEISKKLKALEPFQQEILNYTKSGKKFWLRMSVTPVFDENHNHTHFLAIESDITEEKNRSQRLRMALDEQEELSRDLMLAEMKLRSTFNEGEDKLQKVNQLQSELDVTKKQLLSQEKMASVGVLTAAVAHEMNNPINFLVNGLQAFKNAFQDFLDTQEAIQEVLAKNLPKEALEEIDAIKEEYEFDSVMEEMEGMMGDMQLGVNQTGEIVKGLKFFARADENVAEETDVHELIQTTLVLLRNKLKHNFEVITNFEQNLEDIPCFPTALTQVFMNLIQNAIHAFPSERKDGKIEITTTSNQGSIIIRIKDNGSGIPDKLKPQIFKPFFTTKKVGVGTGLGLPICKEIVEDKHDGQLTFSSQEGEGTEFVIILPRKQ